MTERGDESDQRAPIEHRPGGAFRLLEMVDIDTTRLLRTTVADPESSSPKDVDRLRKTIPDRIKYYLAIDKLAADSGLYSDQLRTGVLRSLTLLCADNNLEPQLQECLSRLNHAKGHEPDDDDFETADTILAALEKLRQEKHYLSDTPTGTEMLRTILNIKNKP